MSERDYYIERTIETIRIHRDADNCWPRWAANLLADEVEAGWAERDALAARVETLENALIDCAEAAGEDGEAVEAARSGAMTKPSVEEFAVNAVRQLRADYDGASRPAGEETPAPAAQRCPFVADGDRCIHDEGHETDHFVKHEHTYGVYGRLFCGVPIGVYLMWAFGS